MSKASKDKRELTQEQLKKVAGGGDYSVRPTGSSSSSRSASTSPYRPIKVIHRISSSSSTSGRLLN